MKVLLRADAGRTRGTGHVMRCLTIAEELQARGHEVDLMGEIGDVPWLEEHIAALGIRILPCDVDTLDEEQAVTGGYERVVVDSYWIEPGVIGQVDARVPVLAIIDGDSRSIPASWYLDQNLGAEQRAWPADVTGRLLAGSRYALVRRSIRRHRRTDGWRLPADRQPRVVAFMGGTDPHDVMSQVASSIAAATPDVALLAVTTASQIDRVRRAVADMPRAEVLSPTDALPDLLGGADLIVSAAGTSAWDVCTIGRPAVLVGVVNNQSEGLARALDAGVALGVDATRDGAAAVGSHLARLRDDEALRRSVVTRALEVFDGLGAARVVAALEQPRP